MLVFFGVAINFAVWGVLILLAAAATDWRDVVCPAAQRSYDARITARPYSGQAADVPAFISLVEMHLVKAGDGGDHHWRNCRSLGSSQHRFPERFHHSRIGPWKDEDGSASDGRCRVILGANTRSFARSVLCAMAGGWGALSSRRSSILRSFGAGDAV